MNANDRTRRDEMIIEMTKQGKTNAEIIAAVKAEFKDAPISDETIRKVRKDAGIKYANNNGFVGGSTVSSEDLYNMILKLQDDISDLKDDLAISRATIKELEAEVIKTNVISTNGITSSKKYEVVYGDNRESVFCDYLELPKALPILAGNCSKGFYNMYPEERIDTNIEEKGKFNAFPDCAYVVFTTAKTFKNMHQQMINASNDNIRESDNQIENIQSMFGHTSSNDDDDE